MPPTTVRIANGMAIGMYWVSATFIPSMKPRLGSGRPTGKVRVGGGKGCWSTPRARIR
jgi:hypothetical protein